MHFQRPTVLAKPLKAAIYRLVVPACADRRVLLPPIGGLLLLCLLPLLGCGNPASTDQSGEQGGAPVAEENVELLHYEAQLGEINPDLPGSLQPLIDLCERIGVTQKEDKDKANESGPSFTVAKDDPDKPLSVSLALDVDLGCGCCSDWTPIDLSDDDLAVLRRYPSVECISIACANGVTDRGLQQLSELPNLRELTLTLNVQQEHAFTSEGIGRLAACERLKALRLWLPRLTNDDLASISELRSLRELVVTSGDITYQGFEYIAQLPRLETLVANQATAEDIRPLAQCKTLTSVCVGCVTDEKLATLGQLPNLEQLALITQDHGVLTDAGLAHVGKITGLEKLAISSPDITNRGLAQLEELSKLEGLSLHKMSQITDESAQSLGRIKSLKNLGIAETSISDEGLGHLSCLKDMETLYLGPNVTDAGLMHLSGMSNLRQLSFDQTNCTGAGLEYLAELKNLQHVGNTTGGFTLLTRDGVEGLNRCKSLQGDLCLRVIEDEQVIEITGQPNITSVDLEITFPVDVVRIVNCPNVERLALKYAIEEGDDAENPAMIGEITFDALPKLRRVEFTDIVPVKVRTRNALENAERAHLHGDTHVAMLYVLSYSWNLREVEMDVDRIHGDRSILKAAPSLPGLSSLRFDARSSGANGALLHSTALTRSDTSGNHTPPGSQAYPYEDARLAARPCP